MNDQLHRIVPLAAIILVTVLFSPFVHAQDYEAHPSLTFQQPYVNTGNVNAMYSAPANLLHSLGGINWKIVLPLALVPIMLYVLWKLASEDREPEYTGARGYQISYHDIRGARKNKVITRKRVKLRP